MTQQEQELLKGLTDRVNSTALAAKDDEAEQTLQRALGGNPDALYILCQTVLVQQFAMSNAQQQLTEARAEITRLQQTAKPQEHGSFLGNLFGLGKGDDDAQAAPAGYAPVHNPAAPTAYQQAAPSGYPPMQPGYGAPAQPPYGAGYPPQYGYGSSPGAGMFGGGGGGFLQGAMQTAAGVVAGEFAFRALEDVFRGGGEGRGFGGGTEVVNNYYSDDAGHNAGGGFGDRLRDADGYDGSVSSDIEDRRGDARGFADSGDGGSSFNAADDGSASDGNDFGGSDDFGGGFDGGGGDDGNNF